MWQDKYDTKTSKALDFYCNEKGMRRGLMTEQDHENFIEWLSEFYLAVRPLFNTMVNIGGNFTYEVKDKVIGKDTRNIT